MVDTKNAALAQSGDNTSNGYQSTIVMVHRNPDGSMRNRYTIEYFGMPDGMQHEIQKGAVMGLLGLGDEEAAAARAGD